MIVIEEGCLREGKKRNLAVFFASRLDQVGVQPTRSIPSEEALDYVLKELIGKSVKPKE